jgi:hypothetical protein
MSLRVLVALALAGFVVSLAVTAAGGGDEGRGQTVAVEETAGDLGPVPRFRPQEELARAEPPTPTPLPKPRPAATAAARKGLDVYRGAGAWVDQYDADVLDNPFPALKEMRDHGVRTVYLETGSWRLPRRLDFRDRTGVELTVDQGPTSSRSA